MGSPIQDSGPIRADVNVCVLIVLIDVHVSAVVVYVYVDIYVGEKFPGGTRGKKTRDTADVDISVVAVGIDTHGLVDGVLLLLVLLSFRLTSVLRMVPRGDLRVPVERR